MLSSHGKHYLVRGFASLPVHAELVSLFLSAHARLKLANSIVVSRPR